MPMDWPAKLNVDVLAIICESLNDDSDVLSFCLTCSTLRPIATWRLLSMRPVHLTWPGGTSFRKFHRFLFADADARAPLIRALNIDMKIDHPEQTAQQKATYILLKTLQTCTRIECLSITFQLASHSIIDSPIVVTAIGALRYLRSLSVHIQFTKHLRLFHAISAPMRKITLRRVNPIGGRVPCWSPSNLEESLSRFAPTLETLELNSFTVDQASVPPVFDMTQYASVRSLSVGSLGGKPLLDHLQHLFPALDGTLSLGALDFHLSWVQSEEVCFERFTNMRAENEQAQERLGSRAWKKLDRVVCTPTMLYVLGLRCPIRLVMLDRCSPNAAYSRYARDALRMNPVPRLKLSMDLESSALTGLGGVVSSELAGTLTHLTLCLVYANDFVGSTAAQAEDFASISWNDLLESVVTELRPLRLLTHLRIVVRANVYRDESIEAIAFGQHSKDFIGAVHGSTFDFDAAAALLTQSLPSLRYLFLTTCGSINLMNGDGDCCGTFDRWHVSRAWRVAAEPDTDWMRDSDAKPVLVALHDEVTRSIIRKEELVLSDADASSARCRIQGKILYEDED